MILTEESDVTGRTPWHLTNLFTQDRQHYTTMEGGNRRICYSGIYNSIRIFYFRNKQIFFFLFSISILHAINNTDDVHCQITWCNTGCPCIIHIQYQPGGKTPRYEGEKLLARGISMATGQGEYSQCWYSSPSLKPAIQ